MDKDCYDLPYMLLLAAKKATQLANVYNCERCRYSCPCLCHNTQDTY